MDLSRLTTADRIMVASGILLVVTLLFLPWYVEKGPELSSVTAVESPNSFWGALALVCVVAAVGLTVVRRLTGLDLPDDAGGRRWDRVAFLLSVVAAALLLFKLLIDPNRVGFGAWLAVVLGVAMAVGGYLADGQGG